MHFQKLFPKGVGKTMIPNNLLYISGPQGSGKTTLKRMLEKQDERFVSYVKLSHLIKLDDPFERQLLRLTKYRIDYDRQKKLAEDNPDKIIICDRCIYDWGVYTEVFRQLGWITKEQFNILDSASRSLFPVDDLPINIVYLDPPLDVIKNWIKGRQAVEGAKWRENNFEYLEKVVTEYAFMYELDSEGSSGRYY